MGHSNAGSGTGVRTLLRNLHMIRTLVERQLEEQPLQEAVKGRLTSSQMGVLRLVGAGAAAGRKSGRDWLISEISRSLEVSFPAASQAVRRLQDDGWLSVRPDAEDSRRRRVRLTARGRKAVRRYEEVKEQLLSELLRTARPGSLRGWNAALEEILAGLLGSSEEPPCLHCGMYAEGSCVAHRAGFECPLRDPGSPAS
jgi:DNA-binding MarR family transcriptional regulator